jgi:tetratricopeptide (TPR) repeat protein
MKKYILGFIIALICSLPLFSQEVEFKVQAPKVVGKGERFKVSFVVNDDKPKHFIAPTFQDVNILSGPNVLRSSSVSIINGKRESNTTTTYTYFLQSLNTGTITIPPAKVTVKDRTYYTKAVNIKVENNPSMQTRAKNDPNYDPYKNPPQPKITQIDENVVFVRAIPNKTKVSLGEEIIISYKIYTLVPISEYQVDKFPSSQGFWVEELDNQTTPSLEREIINGKAYQVATLRQVLVYPQKTGKLKIAPMGLEVLAHIQTGTQRSQRQSTGDPFFDAFFNDPFFSRVTPVFETVNKKLKTNSLEIEVEPLPVTNNAFSGAVGQFTIESKIDTTHCKTNEAITLQYTIKGQGNLTLIDGLKLQIPNEFEVFDPKISDNITKTPAGQRGERTFQYVIIPRVEGNFKIPSLEFTYFNTEKGEYENLTTEEYSLTITKGNNSNELVDQLTEREKYKNMDIIDTPQKHSSNIILSKPFHSYLFYGLIALIIFLLVLMIKLTKVQIEKNKDVVAIRLKKANKVAIKRLKQAKIYLDTNQATEFETEIGQALWNYLSDKFKISRYDLNLDNIKSQLQKSELNEELSNKTLSVLEKCEYVRFSQNKGAELYNELFLQTEELITEIENNMLLIKKQKRNTQKTFLMTALIFLMTTLFSQAADLNQANKAYQQQDYEKALELYKQIETKEVSAELYNNIANTYFRLSDYVNSTLYYEKALKLSPHNKIYQTNNKISKTRLMGDVYKIPDFFLISWLKNIYSLFSPMTWAILTIVLLLITALLFFIYYFSFDKKVFYFYIMLSCLVLTIASFSFGIARQNAIHSQDNAIVIKLPTQNDSKTKLFKGQKVEIKERKLEKIRVQTEDGKEYWIEKDMVAII